MLKKQLQKIKLALVKNFADADFEIQRKLLTVYLFSSIGFLFLFGFGLASIVNQNYQLASVILFASIVTLSNYILLRLTSNYLLASHGVSLISLSISFYLIYSGGMENTGPLWAYSSIPLVLFLQGHIIGLIILSLFLFCTSTIFFLPEIFPSNTLYPDAFKTRFIASFIALTIMSWVYEYTVYKTHLRWRRLSNLFEEQAKTDVLTGLPNRRDITEKLDYENIRAERRNEHYSVMLLDLDYFKSINDNYGHDAGDETLKTVANVLKDTLFERDFVGRWGGEEFIIILPDTNLDGALIAAEKVRKAIEAIVVKYENQHINITVSIGLASIESDEYIYNNTIRSADLRLYKAKELGRNCVVYT